MERYIVHPVSPQARVLEHVADVLEHEGGICVYPTDTVYGMGACASTPRAIDRIGAILHKDKKRLFSFIFADISQMSRYVKISNSHYKLLKRYLPGPYTFILPATNYVPKKVCPKRKTVGVRIPDCTVCIELVRRLGQPLANTSLNMPGHHRGDPDNIEDTVSNEVDVMLDIGVLEDPTGSTIVDLTSDVPEILRKGKGQWYG